MSLIRPRSLQVYRLPVSQSLSLSQQKRAARKGLLLLSLIQLIQRLLEALGETREKPVDFFHMKVFEFFSCRAIGFLKFWISIADFFGAFKEGGEGIGGFGKGPEGILLKGDEIGCVAFLQFFGESREEFLPGLGLDLLILFVEARGEVFHGCREVAGEDFTGIVVEGEHGAVLGICRLMEDVLPDEGEGVGDHGSLESVLGVILGDGAAHETPAGDVFQARHVGKEGIAHFILPHVSP